MREKRRLDGFVDSTQQPLRVLKQFLNDTARSAQTGLIPSDDFVTEVIFAEATCRFLQVISKFHCKYTGEDPDEMAQSVAAELCIRGAGRGILGAVELKSARWTTYLEQCVRNKVVDERRRRTRKRVLTIDEGEKETGEGLFKPNEAVLEKKRVERLAEDKITIDQIQSELSPGEVRLLRGTLRQSAEESGSSISEVNRLKTRLIRSLQEKHRSRKSL